MEFFKRKKKEEVTNENEVKYLMKDVILYRDVVVTFIAIEKLKNIPDANCSVYLASIVKRKMSESIEQDVDLADKIMFEVKENDEITDEIFAKVAGYANSMSQIFGKDLENRIGDFYIGEVNSNLNDTKIKLNSSMDVFFRKKLLPNIIEKRNKKIIEKNKQINANDIKSKFENDEIKKHSYLKKLADVKLESGKTFSNYNGINIEDGKFLRLRTLYKVGKDANGTYLYTGYISSTTKNDEKIEIEDNMAGNLFYPVCFTSAKKLEDIYYDGIENEIYTLLKAFSNPEIFNNNYNMKYIGFVSGLEPEMTIQLTSAIDKELNKSSEKITKK